MRISAANPFWKLAKFALHSLAATLGTMIWASMLIYALRRTLAQVGLGAESRAAQQLLYGPYFPAQIAIALIAGYLAMHHYKHAAILWTWVPPAVVLCIVIASTGNPSVLDDSWSWRFKHFFGTSCSPPTCWDQVAYTANFYSGVAYAIGGLFQSVGVFRFDANPR